MAYTDINKPSDYFNTKLYVGDGTSSQAITGLNFSPDLVWIKDRDYAIGHFLFDTIRGAGKDLVSNATNSEGTNSADGYLSSFDSDGFTLNNGTWRRTGYSGDNYVGWSWRGSDSSAVSNTDGSITSTVSANTISGFSIATWTTPSSGTVFDVGHGLGGKPDMMIMKSRGSVSDWWTWHIGLGDNTTDYLSLNSTNAEASISGMWGTVGAGTSTFGYTAGTSAPTSTDTVAYFFKSVKGFSKFGSYTGNGSTDGTFVYTGFTPAFVMVKQSSTSGNGWIMMDNKRNTFNPNGDFLQANTSDAEDTSSVDCDFLSNGFKMKTTSGRVNTSGATYIYMCFAENPLVSSSGVPCTAR